MTRDEFVKALTIAVDAGIANAGNDVPLDANDMAAIVNAIDAELASAYSGWQVLADVAAASGREFAR